MPLICISAAIIRSGSTWAYNVCRELGELAASSLGQPLTRGYPNMQPLDDLLRTQAHGLRGPAVFKAHKVGPVALDWLRDGRAKAVYTIRDPRDCVSSEMEFQGGGIVSATARVIECLENFSSFPDSEHILPIFYEEMMRDRLGQIRSIAAHLGFGLDDQAIRQIEERTGVGSSQRICQDLKNRPDHEIRRDGTHRVDPVTLLHDNHMSSGKMGRWKDNLTAAQQQALTEQFQPWLIAMGYAEGAQRT